MDLKIGGLSDYQVLFLLLNGPQIEKRLQFNRSIYDVRSSDTLTLPFTSKTGPSVAQNRQKISFYLGFTSK